MRRGYDVLAALLPPLGRLRAQRDALAAERDRLAALLHGGNGSPPLYSPGHFYSPIPDVADVLSRGGDIFRIPEGIPGIDVRVDEQLGLVATLAPFWVDWPYAGEAREGLRYHPDNDYFGHVDGLLLFGLLCKLRPKRYIEVGSGWSSALVLDVRDRYLVDLETTFIEPYPERLFSLLHEGDEARTTICVERAQEVDVGIFQSLEAGDVLFIDSSHVSKIGSDVNHLIFDVLPRVPAGVWIHVHDIRYPFEYSSEWVAEGRAWNEAYVLRALLTDSPSWQIEVWASCLQFLRPEELSALVPPQTPLSGASIWFRRRQPTTDPSGGAPQP